MRIVPLPHDLVIADYEQRARLGPPPGVPSQDCDTIEIVRSTVRLPSGALNRTVRALVWASATELDEIRVAGGTFWLEFLGDTFPPVFVRTRSEVER